MGEIPALNHTIHHSTDRLRRQHKYYEDEILTSRKLMMGHADADPNLTPHFGIVSATDPTAHLTGGNDPLAVSVNAEQQFTVDVNAGFAVFRSGVYLQLNSIIRQVPIQETGTGVPNVVYLRYALDEAPVLPNRFVTPPVSPYTLRVGDPTDAGVVLNNQSVLVGVLTVDTFTQLADSVRQDIVPLAIATVQAVDTGGGVIENQLTIDHTQGSYAFNRPWFSVVDNEHRSQIGTGSVTSTNPHGTSGNDLTVGDLTMFQLQLDHGMVVAKDRSVAKVPGYRCTSSVTAVSVDDASGTVTGFPNASYLELPYFPVRVGRVWVVSTGETLAALQVPQTHRVVFPYEAPPAGEALNVYYTRAEVGEPPLPGNTTFRTNGPTTQELAIAGGLGLVSLSSTEETFADANLVPFRYEMFMDGEAQLLKTPQVVYCLKRLEDIGTSDTFDITPYGPARLIVALVNADDVPALDVQLRIYGTDVNGTTVNELFTFNQANWDPFLPLPSFHEPSSRFMQFGALTFATLDNITVEVRAGEGPNASVMVWMAQTAFSNYDKQADVLHVASVDWDGRSLGRVFDKRVVGATVRDELNVADNAQTQRMLYSLLAGGNQTVYVEDFRRPLYHSLETPTELADGGQTPAYYPTYQFSKQQVGLHGYYRSIAFPVNPGSGTLWRIAMNPPPDNIVDTWFSAQAPTLWAYQAGLGWQLFTMTPVAGVVGTWEVDIGGSAPTRVQAWLYPGQCSSMAIYG